MGHSQKWWDMYHAMLQHGVSKEIAAKTANKHHSKKAAKKAKGGKK